MRASVWYSVTSQDVLMEKKFVANSGLILFVVDIKIFKTFGTLYLFFFYLSSVTECCFGLGVR